MASEDVRVSGKDLAALIGCRPSYVVELKRKGRLVLAEDGKGYLRDASLALYGQTQDPSYTAVAERHAAARGSALVAAGVMDEEDGDAEAETEAKAPPTKDSLRKAKALADKAEIDAMAAARDYEVSMGKLLDAGQVEHVLAEAATAIRVELERMADTLAPQLAATTDESRCRELVWNEVSHALEEMSRGFRSASAAVVE